MPSASATAAAKRPVRLSSRWIALAICLYAFALGIVYAAETPIFEAPDEGAHFLYIHNLLESGELPVLEDRDTVFRSRSVQRHHPPLYYLVGAALIAWTDRADVDAAFIDNPFGAIGFVSENNQNIYLHRVSPPTSDTAVAVWVLRLYSLVLGVITLWLVYRAGETAFPGRPVGLLAMAFVASIPGFIAGSASVNNDNLVTLLFAAGVVWSLRVWRSRAISNHDIALISLILSGSALAKLTGLALFPLVYAALAWGAWRGYFSGRRAAQTVAVSLGAAALLAGWWYLRNWQLYGDPFALYRTLRIWGRGSAVSSDLEEWLFEAKGVWDSFWMTLGHFNIRGPEWLYGYAPLLTVLGFVGVVVAWRRLRRPQARDGILLLGATLALVIAALAAATRQINVSQGRIVYPALIAFAPLLALGWRMLLGRLAPLLIVPLAALTLATPFLDLDDAYAGLEVIAALPPDAIPVEARAETLSLVGYRLHTPIVAPGDPIRLDIYFRGRHDENPAFFVKALDPMTQETLGGVDLYPGMAPTDDLQAEPLYHARIDFRLDEALSSGRAPMQLPLAVGWRVPGTERYLPWQDAAGTPLDLLTLDGPTLIDPAAPEPIPQTLIGATFGGVIRLHGYTAPETTAAGEVLPVRLVWEAVAPIPDAYTLTLGLVDESGQLVTQSDGMLPGYPTSAWVTGDRFAVERVLDIPANTVPGDYRLYVGWYSTPDITRLLVQGDGAQDNLLYLPQRVRVEPPAS